MIPCKDISAVQIVPGISRHFLFSIVYCQLWAYTRFALFNAYVFLQSLACNELLYMLIYYLLQGISSRDQVHALWLLAALLVLRVGMHKISAANVHKFVCVRECSSVCVCGTYAHRMCL